MNELSETYYSKSDDELLLIYSEASELTPEAREVLKAEMNRRGLTQREAEGFRDHLEFERTNEAKAEENKRLTQGGRRWFGKANAITMTATQRERFDTTFFITFLIFPMIPLGSYRIEVLKKGWRKNVIILQKLPLNWEQVLRAWVFTGIVALAAIWSLKLWIYFQYRR